MFFCEESLRKINEKDVELFRNGSVHESVDYFETRNYFRRRKKKDLYEQNFDGEANRSGVVNFHCMQTSCDEHTQSIQKQIVEYDIKIKSWRRLDRRWSRTWKTFSEEILFRAQVAQTYKSFLVLMTKVRQT